MIKTRKKAYISSVTEETLKIAHSLMIAEKARLDSYNKVEILDSFGQDALASINRSITELSKVLGL